MSNYFMTNIIFGEIETLVQDGFSQQVAQVRRTISCKYGATEKHNFVERGQY